MTCKKKPYHILLIAFGCVIPVCNILFAQDADVLKKQLDQYSQNVLQEKLYVHTDRDLYLAGEIAWFKLYAVDGSFHKPLDLSKVAYVEILDPQNKPVLQAKISLKKGEGNGSFFLPVTTATGKYTFRAYTNWMKNAGADFFYHKTITIINSQISQIQAGVTKTGDTDIQFFPEGGNLVENIQGKIACKVTDQYGKGISYTGFVVDENNNRITNFNSLHAGMGSFLLTPQPGHTYKAIIETGTQNRITKELPAVYPDGYAMRVNTENGNRLTVHIQSNKGNNKTVYVLAHTRQSVKTAVSIPLRNGSADITIDKNKLGDGISHITVFNSNRQPVCERLYFNYPLRQLQVDAKTGVPEYGARKKIDVSVSTTGMADQKTNSVSLSMAVFKLDSLQTESSNSINTYLLLTSDLKGNVESPAYYFSNQTPEIVEATDNLMLTQGWRRFSWEKVLQNNTPAFSFVPEYNGHLITGKIYDSHTGKPAPNIQGYLSVPGKYTQFSPSVSDNNGQVRFEMKNMIGSGEIVVQTNSLKDSIYKIDILNPFSDSYATIKTFPLVLSPSYADRIVSKSIGMQVQNIYSGSYLRQFNYPDRDTTAFYGKPDAVYFLDNYTRFTTLEEVLREYVIFMSVQKTRGKFHIPLVDLTAQALVHDKQILFDNDPLVLLDGVPLFDISRFMNMDSRKIRKLEIYNRRQEWRGAYFDGILNWTTYNGNLSDLELDPNAIAIDYEGLQPERIFYAPVYDTNEKINNHLPDFRNLLYWAPSIHTTENGKAVTGFYSSDTKGKYAIVIQALAADGKSGSAVSTFEVK
jgi:hypothetical protein